jgi:hypothetical protein
MKEESASFFIKKEAKKFSYSGAWAFAASKPQAQSHKSLFGSFSSEKELLVLDCSL